MAAKLRRTGCGTKSLKPIPTFESEDEEREFWATHDSTEHVDWSRARPTIFSGSSPRRRRFLCLFLRRSSKIGRLSSRGGMR